MGLRNSPGKDFVRNGRRVQGDRNRGDASRSAEVIITDQAGLARRQHRAIREKNDEGRQVRELDSNEIRNQVKDIPEQMFRLKFQLAMGQTDGVKKLRNLRKDRARMLTILRDRELNPDSAPEPVAKKKKGK